MPKLCKLSIFIAVLVLTLSGCGKAKDKDKSEDKSDAASDIATCEVLAHVFNEVPLESSYICYLNDNEKWKNFADIFFKFDDELISEISDIAIVVSNSATADEYIILKTTDTDAAVAALNKHRDTRIGDFTGYVPEEEASLRNATVECYGDYVALLVCSNSSKAVTEFKKAVKPDFKISDSALATLEQLRKRNNPFVDADDNGNSNNEVTEQKPLENEDLWSSELVNADPDATRFVLSDGSVLIKEISGVIEPVNTDNIVEAYKTGNTSLLTDSKDVEVLNKCKEIIDTIITPDMSDYDKEAAIYDYIAANTEYDEKCLILSDWYSEYADTPYGCLIDKRAICLGYTTTFKLFMDMLDIECIIVKGSANYDYANHAWNMVKLDDGCWYNVDATWSLPMGDGDMDHTYLNCDDKFFLDTNHHWIQDDYPAAIGGKYSSQQN